MIRSVFEAAAVTHPEMHSPTSRAMYGVDVMLDSSFQPKLLEVCNISNGYLLRLLVPTPNSFLSDLKNLFSFQGFRLECLVYHILQYSLGCFAHVFSEILSNLISFHVGDLLP